MSLLSRLRLAVARGQLGAHALADVIEHAVMGGEAPGLERLLGATLDAVDRAPAPRLNFLRERSAAVELHAVRAALERSGWRVDAAARELGTSRKTVYRIVERDERLARDLERHGHERGRPRVEPEPGTEH